MFHHLNSFVMRLKLFLSVFVIFIVCSHLLIGQQCGINYTYDNAGNRIKRSVCVQGNIVVNSDDTIIDHQIDNIFFSNENELSNLMGKPNNANIAVFPNPTNGKIMIDGVADPHASFSFYDLTGKLLMTNSLSVKEIDVSTFPDGKYLLLIKDNDLISKSIIILAK